jgi:uncharacterized repeat protein (TIGR04138 family)
LGSLAFKEGIMERIRTREPRFHEHAYLFVLASLEFCQARLPERRHISGAELAMGCRDLALDRFGVLAGMVLEHRGVRTSADIGDNVFNMVEQGLLLTQPGDSRDEFAGVFDFQDAFDADYPWNCESVA